MLFTIYELKFYNNYIKILQGDFGSRCGIMADYAYAWLFHQEETRLKNTFFQCLE